MGKINVTIIDTTGNKEHQAGLPDDVAVNRLMGKLVEKMSLPSTGPDGAALSYKLIHKASGKQLADDQTLADAKVKDKDVLRVQAEITAGR